MSEERGGERGAAARLHSRGVPTIYDVAAAAGVSKSVVSRVLSGSSGVAGQTIDRVQRAAADLGYVANAHARGMSAHRTHTLGVFVRDASTPFYGHLLTAFQEQAAVRGYRVVTATGAGSFSVDDERRALEALVALRVEGLIVCSGALPVEDILPFARRIPTVVAGRPEQNPTISSVYCDEVRGGRALADHVADLGHRRVAVMTFTPVSSITQSRRTYAMAERLREREVDVVIFGGDDAGPGFDGADGIVAAVLEEAGVTAFMAPSDAWAVAILEALRERGISVPAELSVTGYDGVTPFMTSLLGLTSWRQPLRTIGQLSVDAVVDQIDRLATAVTHYAINGELLPGRTATAP